MMELLNRTYSILSDKESIVVGIEFYRINQEKEEHDNLIIVLSPNELTKHYDLKNEVFTKEIIAKGEKIYSEYLDNINKH